MRAAVYYNNKDVRVEEVPRPEIKKGELLVKVEASGICGSDVMEWYRVKKAPLVLGHEIAGTVEEIGEGVEGLEKGDRVTVSHHVPCNVCRYCLSGNYTVCDTLRATNFDPGGFSEYVRVPAVNVERGGVFRLPNWVSFEDATFAEPLGCVVRGFRIAGMSPGKSVLVIGSGISGLLHVKLAKIFGASFIAAVDINEDRLGFAKRFGADVTVLAKENPKKAIVERFGRLCDIVSLTAAGDSAITQGIGCVERGGTILFFAPREPEKTYPMPLFGIWKDQITFKNTYASAPLDTLTALELIAGGKVIVKDMITNRLPLSEIQRGFDMASAAGESVKVMIAPQK
ncbi:MAG: alcohol dehydrogenase catalytic domain-containing protein [Deltaproteobacteria bacterium]|nr:alcohol dehydrogenase catalytic domain-containing protein [Deltaproteobacteria bacterium]